MKWDKNKSVLLSKISLWLFAALLALACIATPWYKNIAKIIFGQYVPTLHYVIIVLLFAVPAYIAIYYLYRLLTNIEKEKVFTSENIKCLRSISWCCFAGGIIFFFGAFYAISCIMLCGEALFVAVILRVVKNVFEQAVALQNENDLTI